MSGVTHNRAIPEDEPRLFGMDLDCEGDARLRATRLAYRDQLVKERAVYIGENGLKRTDVKKADRAAWEKHARELTTEILKIEVELGL